MDRYEEMLSRYKTDLDDAQVAAAVEKIVRDNLATNSTPDVYKFFVQLYRSDFVAYRG